MSCIRSFFLGLFALSGLSSLGIATASAATEPCELLNVPEGYDFSCTVERQFGEDDWEASVQPLDGAFAGLSRLNFAPIEGPVSEPESWLKDQVKIDLTGLESAVTSVVDDENSPFAEKEWWQSLQGLKDAVHSLSDLPLDACNPPQTVGEQADWKIDCDWGLGSLRNYMSIYLVERDGQYYTLKVQSMNERRYRHLVAIANSF